MLLSYVPYYFAFLCSFHPAVRVLLITKVCRFKKKFVLNEYNYCSQPSPVTKLVILTVI